MDNEVADFWSAFEKETGEKVEARSEGVWYRVPNSGAGHEGLLILTNKSFRFKYVPKTVAPLMGPGLSPEFVDETEFTVARGDIVSVRLPKRGFFAWIVRRSFPRCSMVTRGKGGEKTYVFSVDPSSGLLAALAKAWPNAAGRVVHKG
jgi:hypothetical protein